MFEQVGQNMMLFLETKDVNSTTVYVNKQFANGIISQRQLFTLMNLMEALTAGVKSNSVKADNVKANAK